MSDLAQILREYIATCPDFPVSKKFFLIDYLDEDNGSISLQLNPGIVLAQEIDGYMRIQQPFTLLYRDSFSNSATFRANMMGVLNKIGDWLTETVITNPQGDYDFESFRQLQTANILSQDAKDIIYQASFELIFNKN